MQYCIRKSCKTDSWNSYLLQTAATFFAKLVGHVRLCFISVLEPIYNSFVLGFIQHYPILSVLFSSCPYQEFRTSEEDIWPNGSGAGLCFS